MISTRDMFSPKYLKWHFLDSDLVKIHIISKPRSSAEGKVWSENGVSSQETTSTVKAKTVCVLHTMPLQEEHHLLAHFVISQRGSYLLNMKSLCPM